MIGKINRSIQTKLVLPIMFSALAVIGISIACMLYLKQQNMELAGAAAASSVANQMQSLRGFYSETVVPRIKKAGMQPHFEFLDHDDRLPAPATLVNVLGNKLNADHPGSRMRLFSRYPFAHRADTETYDAFQMDALLALEQDPSRPFYRMEIVDGRLSMRYAVPDIMKKSCVTCHNSHPLSPKKDWQEGDVRGALEVVIPVDDTATAMDQGTFMLVGLISAALLAMGLIVVMVCRRTLIDPVRSLSRTNERIRGGDLQARATIESQDELGAMANEFNALLDRMVSLVETTEADRDNMQESIMRLLAEVSDVAKGDLTVAAVVTEDMTGAIADSFNHMIGQLRQLVTSVRDATLQVSASASQIQNTAEQLAEGSISQAEQIVDSAAALDEMAVSIQQVSENASLSATVADQALANAKQGTLAVQNTVEAMHRMRDQVQETSARIQSLGQRSQEISEIVQLIADIADRTGVLALNASIEASLAGEAGQGFAIVAHEVERLAERATDATKQINDLVDSIQSETHEAMMAMVSSTREVAEGSRVADQAGQALREIESVSTRLADLIQSISLAATQQARGSESLSRAMSEISEVTQDTASGTKQAAESISQLAMLADELRGSVSTFKLPASMAGSYSDL
jgi:methyl-accepting chemotaxis protein